MDNRLRELLQSAVGEPQDVIAVILDIRGFTQFCLTVGESTSIAAFIKRVYIGIMDKYFENAAFYKPTGDGLLIVIPYTPDNLKEVLCNTVRNCLDITKNFRKLSENDPMINFDTPEKVGIGLSRGVVCRISSQGTILDYSGKAINLASRLNDLARPSGIVFDSNFGFKMLPPDIQTAFQEDAVSIRGIAEKKPLKVYFTREQTIIPPSRRQPLEQLKWEIKKNYTTLEKLKSEISKGTEFSRFLLPKKPMDQGQIIVNISFRPYPTQEKKGIYLIHSQARPHPWIICRIMGKDNAVFVKNKELVEFLVKAAAKDKDDITAEIHYPTEE